MNIKEINAKYEIFEEWANKNDWFLVRLYNWGITGKRCAEWISPNGNIVSLWIDSNNQIEGYKE